MIEDLETSQIRIVRLKESLEVLKLPIDLGFQA
jgi:hypothetical protein